MKTSLPILAIIVVALTALIIDFDLQNWKKTERVIEHDIHHYYAYLPAKFIYDDIKLQKSDYRFGDDLYYFWPVKTKEGHKVVKMTMGLSVLYAPFFFTAHLVANTFDYETNGFSEPYKFFLLLSAVFYLIIGLDFMRKNLAHFGYSDKVITVTILLVGLGTNLLCYASQSAPMPHVYLFCLFSIFLHYTIKWHLKPTTANSIIIGLLLGFITLIRPTNIIIFIIFILYGVSTFRQLNLKKYPFNFIIIIILTMFLVWIPQFLYWKTVTGSYIYYSYNIEKFYFNKPKIWKGLMSFQKGWLIYTPIMFFALWGLTLLKAEARKLQLGLIIFMVINIYVIFSWWCWWYGGTYGQRSLIDSYALLCVPLAALINWISVKKLHYRVLFSVLGAFFIWLNIFQTYQFEYHSLHWEAMTKKLYFKQFGKLEKIDDFESYLVYPDVKEAIKGNR